MPRGPPGTTATLPLRSNRSIARLRRPPLAASAPPGPDPIDGTGPPTTDDASALPERPSPTTELHGCVSLSPMTGPSMPAQSSAAPPVGATSEVGRLRTVVLHRPGPELT